MGTDGAAGSRDSFSVIHGDLMREFVNVETKRTAGSLRSGYSTYIYAINKWRKTSHVHSNHVSSFEKKLKFTKKMTPGNKSMHFEHILSIFGG